MGRKISEGRKTAYYVGMGLMIVGGLLFASTFVSFIAHFGDFNNFEGRAKSGAAMAFGGMALLVVGGIVMGIGARGAAGSGLILNPDKAREDLEPFSRMGGGMLKDALDEADIHLGSSGPRAPDKVVMIKCRACGRLNEEDSKFCQECGKPL
ncbi:MAG: zinc ribbon domain-containing protein [Phycisphaerae bacterium]|nr:zinc ribbon domain-containing protein [Phycisphaerae bacterium]